MVYPEDLGFRSAAIATRSLAGREQRRDLVEWSTVPVQPHRQNSGALVMKKSSPPCTQKRPRQLGWPHTASACLHCDGPALRLRCPKPVLVAIEARGQPARIRNLNSLALMERFRLAACSRPFNALAEQSWRFARRTVALRRKPSAASALARRRQPQMMLATVGDSHSSRHAHLTGRLLWALGASGSPKRGDWACWLVFGWRGFSHSSSIADAPAARTAASLPVRFAARKAIV
ncbi:hypothetical protein LAD54_27445 [Klebsiella pneumoniae]|nr:hypothetical protein [Klebsiella pneumoniae]